MELPVLDRTEDFIPYKPYTGRPLSEIRGEFSPPLWVRSWYLAYAILFRGALPITLPVLTFITLFDRVNPPGDYLKIGLSVAAYLTTLVFLERHFSKVRIPSYQFTEKGVIENGETPLFRWEHVNVVRQWPGHKKWREVYVKTPEGWKRVHAYSDLGKAIYGESYAEDYAQELIRTPAMPYWD